MTLKQDPDKPADCAPMTGSENHFADISPQSPQRFLNRELSMLAFNTRVLTEACNPANPLLERVRFLSITASNQEEFFMIRVAGLKAKVKAGLNNPGYDGLTPREQLKQIDDVTQTMAQNMQRCWDDLRTALAEQNIHILKPAGLTAEDSVWVKNTFATEIFPLLTPVAVDPAHPFPFIPNKGIALALMLANERTDEDSEALIVLPPVLPRFYRLPGTGNRYISLEDMILHHIDQFFPAPLRVRDYAVFRVLRDSEMDIQEEFAEDIMEVFQSALKRRRRGNVTRLTVTQSIAPPLLAFLKKQLKVADHDVLLFGDLVGLTDVRELITADRRDLQFRTFNPRFPERIREFKGDCFAAIRHKDFIIHHPYESFDVVVQFLKQAAKDPNVVAIKQTIYRTGRESPIIDALIEAAENGKTVTAVVELKARFDEEANLRWARDMERAGVQVIFGFMNLKTHAKVSLITRREGKKVTTYVHYGTGNYHSETARVYTDLSFFTCDPELCKDAGLLFNYMTSYAEPTDLSKLIIAPMNMRRSLVELIDGEIARAREGTKAQIWIKCNALVDGAIIDKLYEASNAGVEIDLIVRGVCTLRPEIKGLSENIRVKSIVGRYLEHSRIYCFANGHDLPSPHAKVFISSGDLMTRNLDRRIETFIPITNPTIHKQVLEQIMVANLKDQRNSWLMQPDGTYQRPEMTENPFNAHEYFMNNPSLSGRGKALEAAPAPPHLQLDKRRHKT